jgi:hypothetical protein
MKYQRLLALLGEPYTEHSIKRGALYTLLFNGAPLETIRIMAKHRSMRTLLMYLRPVDVIGRYGTVEASRLL